MDEDLFDYIPDVPDDFLEISQFVLLPVEDEENSLVINNINSDNNNISTNNTHNNNYTNFKCNTHTNYNKNSSELCLLSDNNIPGHRKLEDPFPKQNTEMVKAKRGRPPSKPPTKKVIRKRRKVG